MSGSDCHTAIFLSDTPKELASKVKKHAFSGGRATLEEHRLLGGDPAIDVSFRYLEFFLEDDAELAEIAASYRSGVLLSGELKAKAITCLTSVLERHQAARAQITDDILQEVQTPRILPLPVMVNSADSTAG